MELKILYKRSNKLLFVFLLFNQFVVSNCGEIKLDEEFPEKWNSKVSNTELKPSKSHLEVQEDDYDDLDSGELRIPEVNIRERVVKSVADENDLEAARAQVQLVTARNTNQFGGIWPIPQKLHYDSQNRTLRKNGVIITFRGGTRDVDCDILEFAKNTYLKKWLFPSKATTSSAGSLTLVVKLRKRCPRLNEYPQLDMNEQYRLRVPFTGEATLEADEIWGILRGLETFSQLIYQPDPNTYLIRTATIHDWPEYPVRGILLDTSRHYLHKNLILRQIDLMAQNKMNLLHWHIVDMESFPFVSKQFPNMSREGAYTSKHIYDPGTVKEVIQYARLQGVRVMVEFDSPGHMASWKGQHGLLAECYNLSGSPVSPSMIDPTSDKVYVFLRQFFKEVLSTFPDQFIHLGGDETRLWTEQCWYRNPKIRQFMEKQNFTSITLLEDYYFAKLQRIILDLFGDQPNKRRMVFWQEVFTNNNPDPNAIIHIWTSRTAKERARDLAAITSKGYAVLLSSCWYLNLINYGADWKAGAGQYYYCDPRGFSGSYEQKQLVLGGVATMWAEYVDGTNLESRLWPRASAVAERLWSDPNQTTDADVAWPRLQEHRCRMVARGYRAQPINGPEFCSTEWEDPLL